MNLKTRDNRQNVSQYNVRELSPASRWWNWIEDNESERILRIDGVIAEEPWIDDEITPKQFKSELMSGSGDITLWINSPGGDVFAASQIYNILMDYKGNVTVKIDGLAASAASVIAMAVRPDRV